VSFQSLPKRGNLIPALAISSLLHFLLLWPAASPHNDGEILRALVATLRPPPALGAKPPPPALASAKPPSPQKALASAAETIPAAPLPGFHNNIHSTAEIPLRSGSPAAAASASLPVALPEDRGDAAGAELDAEGVRQFRMALAAEARRFKRYPPQAQETNMTGTVEIRVVVAAPGGAREVHLARSSGHELLDDAALDMMTRAAPRAALPETLRRRAFVVSLPVVFDLAGD